MRVLLTGATGFVGQHLQLALPGSLDVWSVARTVPHGPRTQRLDITDAAAVSALLAELRPQVVVHLAAIAQAGAHPPGRLRAVDVDGAAHVADAAWSAVPGARVIAVSTGYVYGETPHAATEATPCAPVGAYAEAKAEMERVVRSLGRGRDLCVPRPFNHAGPGQSTDYAVAAFADKVARLERAAAPPVLSVGDLTAVRDLSDVRDLARALAWLVTAPTAPPVVNLCSGHGRAMGAVLDGLLARSTLDPRAVEVASTGRSRLRRSVGAPTRARQLGLPAPRAFEHTLTDVLAEARARVSPAGAATPTAATGPG